MPGRFRGLWRHGDFLRLWGGQTVSLFGTLISVFALPLIAIIELDASPIQLALLSTAQVVPAMLGGPIAGVVVDRAQRLSLMIVADLARAALLLTLPLAAALDRLGLIHLYAVAATASVFNVLFEVAYRAYLPTLVGREDLVEANSKLQASAAVAEVGGFGLGGLLVQALTAPYAIALDAVSFLGSAWSLRRIRAPEPAVDRAVGDGVAAHRFAAIREMVEGGRHLWADARLRWIAGSTAIFEFSRSIVGVVIALFLVRGLNLAPGALGPIFALGGVSALVGALVAQRVVGRWGLGPALVLSLALAGSGTLLVAAAGGSLAAIVAILALSQLLGDGAATVANIGQVSFVQGSTPDRLLGRVMASFGLLERAAVLLGLLAGGLLGEAVGPRATIAVGGSGIILSSLWLLASPVRTLRAAAEPVLGEEPAT